MACGKIAVCVSGENHAPNKEALLRQMQFFLSFLVGLDVDIYIHSLHDDHQLLIKEYLKPTAMLFEKKPYSSEEMNEAYSMKKCYNLLVSSHIQYKYIIHFSPNIVAETSLMETLKFIEHNCSEAYVHTVFFPSTFHGDGINSHFSICSMESSSLFFNIHDYMVPKGTDLEDSTQHVFLKYVLHSGINIQLFPFSYALMPTAEYTIPNICRIKHNQELAWYSKELRLPSMQTMNDFFSDKLAAVDASKTLLGKKISAKSPKKNICIQCEFYANTFYMNAIMEYPGLLPFQKKKRIYNYTKNDYVFLSFHRKRIFITIYKYKKKKNVLTKIKEKFKPENVIIDGTEAIKSFSKRGLYQ